MSRRFTDRPNAHAIMFFLTRNRDGNQYLKHTATGTRFNLIAYTALSGHDAESETVERMPGNCTCAIFEEHRVCLFRCIIIPGFLREKASAIGIIFIELHSWYAGFICKHIVINVFVEVGARC